MTISSPGDLAFAAEGFCCIGALKGVKDMLSVGSQGAREWNRSIQAVGLYCRVTVRLEGRSFVRLRLKNQTNNPELFAKS